MSLADYIEAENKVRTLVGLGHEWKCYSFQAIWDRYLTLYECLTS
jgi:hypothetical protein